MNYQEKKQRWLQVQCKSWSDPDYSFLISELEKAWAALEHITACKRLDKHNCTLEAVQQYARDALNS